MKNSLFFVISLFLVTMIACKSKKEVIDTSKSLNIKSLNQKIKAATFDYDYFSAKAKMRYSDKSINQNFTANIKMEKDEYIWMSLTGFFGIEGGRVLITKNRVQIIDRLNRVYYNKPLSFVSNYVPFDVDLVFLQNLILANPIQNDLPKQKIEINNQQYLATGNLGSVASLYYIMPELFKYRKVEMKDESLNREIFMDFEDYKKLEDFYFPYQRDYVFKEKANTSTINMNFSKAKIENSLDYSFDVPSHYKKVE